MKRHERSMRVEDARLDFVKALLKIEKEYDLTFGEMFNLLGEQLQRLSGDLIQTERHPDDPDKSGDIA